MACQLQLFSNVHRLGVITLFSLSLAACGGGGGGGGDSGTTRVTGNPPSVSANAQELSSVSSSVSLSATATDPDGDTIAYSWTQSSGAAVSNTSGFDTATATFDTPESVDTLRFTVTATAGGQSDSTVVRVVVVEDIATAVFVDGEFSGTSDGSINSPYGNLQTAITSSNETADFYIKTQAGNTPYVLWPSLDDEVFLRAQSVYGGYNDNWERDPVGNQTRVDATGRGLLFQNYEGRVTVSGLSLNVSTPDREVSNTNVWGIAAESSTGEFVAEQNTIFLNGPDGTFGSQNVDLFGVAVASLPLAMIYDNVIETGNALLAADRTARQNTGADGLDAEDNDGLNNTNGGEGAAQSGVGWNGGDGGEGGRTSFEPGDSGSRGSGRSTPVLVSGGAGGSPGVYDTVNRTEVGGGRGGDGDAGPRGASGAGGVGSSPVSSSVGAGEEGGDGWAGGGGGGGGGGSGASAGRNGGGGGGGGEGGEGGDYGFGGFAGPTSAALVVFEVATATVARNNLTSGDGGLGGFGGTGGAGGSGGSGGAGGPANAGSSADGGRGGSGGDGGQGGYGGGGAGGGSFGIWVSADIAPIIEENTITVGRGGDGAPPRLSFEAFSAGAGGWAYGIIDADLNDGVTPDVRNNTIVPGTGGNNGHPDNAPGDSGDVRLQ